LTNEPLATPRLLRPVGPPLGVYLRPSRNDHSAILQLLAEGSPSLAGVVFDPCLEARQEELRSETLRHQLETVLDPRAVELATASGFKRAGVAQLPWASEEPHTPDVLRGSGADELLDPLARYVASKSFSAVLAPTHYLVNAHDPWLEVDAALARGLRDRLDAAGKHETVVYYPLALHASAFRDATQRRMLIAPLDALPVDGVWLRIHPFGSTSGPMALQRYIEACRDFHALRLPLVAEHTGTIGIALMSFGAVGGMESGLTYGERYDISPMLKEPRDNNPFLPPPRVYLPELGTFLSKAQASAFFENRQMKSAFGCRDSTCCRRGTIDTLANPRRHFMVQRLREVASLSHAPETLRPQLYLDNFLRPASDRALRAARVEPALTTTRQRLDAWRETLGAMARRGVPSTFSVVPEGRRIRRRLGA
jgi:hypothetical protein